MAPKEQPPRKLSGKRTDTEQISEEPLAHVSQSTAEASGPRARESLRSKTEGAFDLHGVTLIEKNRYPGMETSYANGGQLSDSNAEVCTHPSTLIKGLKWMFKSDTPLLMNPTPTWHKLSWMTEFIAAIPHYRQNTIDTARLAIASRAHHLAWAESEGIEFHHKREGILHIYRDKKGFDHTAEASKLLAKGGLERHAVTPHEMQAIEPTLQGEYYGRYFTESDSTSDIHKFTYGLAKATRRRSIPCRRHCRI